jgi:F0F1-type ATP synthase alpha subunit
VREFERGLLDTIHAQYTDTIIKPIMDTGEISDDVEAKIKQAIEGYKANFGS